MKTNIVLLSMAVAQHLIVAEEAKLPAESQLLLTKMEQFERDTRAKAEEAIEIKRKQVASILTQQMRTEARNGKVDVAIKIRESVQKLTPAIIVEEVKLTETKPAHPWIGTTWRTLDPVDEGWTFEADGTGNRVYDKRDIKFTWEVGEKKDSVRLRFDNKDLVFTFDSRRTGVITIKATGDFHGNVQLVEKK